MIAQGDHNHPGSRVTQKVVEFGNEEGYGPERTVSSLSREVGGFAAI